MPKLTPLQAVKRYKTPDISVPKLRKVKVDKDYSAHLIIVSLIALFLYFAFTGQLSGEMYVN